MPPIRPASLPPWQRPGNIPPRQFHAYVRRQRHAYAQQFCAYGRRQRHAYSQQWQHRTNIPAETCHTNIPPQQHRPSVAPHQSNTSTPPHQHLADIIWSELEGIWINDNPSSVFIAEERTQSSDDAEYEEFVMQPQSSDEYSEADDDAEAMEDEVRSQSSNDEESEVLFGYRVSGEDIGTDYMTQYGGIPATEHTDDSDTEELQSQSWYDSDADDDFDANYADDDFDSEEELGTYDSDDGIPASKLAIKSLPSVVLEPNAEVADCVICMDEMCELDGDDQITKLPCSHLFHRDCIVLWLSKHNTCPTCRFKLPTDK